MAITRTLRVISGATLTGALVFASSPNAAADEVRDKQWPLTSLEAQALWKVTKGEGQTVAVIDDGVKADHVDLQGNVLKGKDFIDGGSASPGSGEAHGTGMSGAIAGHGHGSGESSGIIGLAPKAKILPIRDLGHQAEGYAKSIRYAVDRGATVINISQGQSTPRASSEEQEAIAYALDRNVLVVASSGNGEGEVGYPASYPGVIAVGGVKEDGTAWEDSDSGPEILLNAPASEIVHAAGPSNLAGYGITDGNSYATAFVSASAALIKAKHPDLTAGQVANRLTKTATLPDSEQGLKLPDEQYGYGSIQPLAALTEDIPKGSKFGPLTVPESLKAGDETSPTDDAAVAQQQDQKQMLFLGLTALVGLVILGAIVLVIVLVVRKKKRGPNGPGGPGGPAGWGPPGQAPGYGQPPHQQQPPNNSYSPPPGH